MRASSFVGSAVVVGLALVGFTQRGSLSASAGAATPENRAVVAQAIDYARAQLGKPYQWGGTGPDVFDCSGLVMDAFRSAGVSIPRTSGEQWATGPRVARPRRGDAVFFAGQDGTDADPGHVGLVVNPAKHLMIDAYGPAGAPISYDTYGLATSRPGLTHVVGFTSPAGS